MIYVLIQPTIDDSLLGFSHFVKRIIDVFVKDGIQVRLDNHERSS